jgi:RimJ/RimL family protein N-acetyltransferase
MRPSAGASIELQTTRLDLRPLVPSDAPWYLAHFSDPEVVHGSGFPAPTDLAAASEELRVYVFDLVAQGTGMRWGIARRGHDELIGSIGYYNLRSDPVRQAQIRGTPPNQPVDLGGTGYRRPRVDRLPAVK